MINLDTLTLDNIRVNGQSNTLPINDEIRDLVAYVQRQGAEVRPDFAYNFASGKVTLDGRDVAMDETVRDIYDRVMAKAFPARRPATILTPPSTERGSPLPECPDVRDMYREIDSLRNELRTLQKEHFSLIATLENRDARIAQLEGHLRELNGVQHNLHQAERALAESRERVQGLEGHVGNLESELLAVGGDNETLRAQLAQARVDLRAAQAEVEHFTRAQETLNRNLETAQQRTAASEQRVQELEVRVRELETADGTNRREIENARRELEHAQRDAHANHAEVQRLQNQLHASNGENRQLQGRVRALQEDLDTIRAERDRLNMELQNNRQALQRAQEERVQSTRQIEQLRGELTTARRRHRELEAQVLGETEDRFAAERETLQLRGRCAELERHINEARNANPERVAALEQELADHERRIAQLEGRNHARAENDGRVAQLERNIANLEQRLATADANHEATRNALAAAQQQLADAQAQATQEAEARIAAQGQLRQAQAELQRAQEREAELHHNIAELQQRLATADANHEATRNALTVAQAQREALEEDLDTANLEVGFLEARIEEEEARSTELENQCAVAQARAEEAEAQVAALEATIRENNAATEAVIKESRAAHLAQLAAERGLRRQVEAHFAEMGRVNALQTQDLAEANERINYLTEANKANELAFEGMTRAARESTMAFNTERENLGLRIAQLREELDTLKAERTNGITELNDLQEESEKLARQLSNTRQLFALYKVRKDKEIDELKQARATVETAQLVEQEAKTALEQQVERLKVRNQILTQVNKGDKETLKAVRQQVAGNRGQIEGLTEQVNALRTQRDLLKENNAAQPHLVAEKAMLEQRVQELSDNLDAEKEEKEQLIRDGATLADGVNNLEREVADLTNQRDQIFSIGQALYDRSMNRATRSKEEIEALRHALQSKEVELQAERAEKAEIIKSGRTLFTKLEETEESCKALCIENSMLADRSAELEAELIDTRGVTEERLKRIREASAETIREVLTKKNEEIAEKDAAIRALAENKEHMSAFYQKFVQDEVARIRTSTAKQVLEAREALAHTNDQLTLARQKNEQHERDFEVLTNENYALEDRIREIQLKEAAAKRDARRAHEDMESIKQELAVAAELNGELNDRIVQISKELANADERQRRQREEFETLGQAWQERQAELLDRSGLLEETVGLLSGQLEEAKADLAAAGNRKPLSESVLIGNIHEQPRRRAQSM